MGTGYEPTGHDAPTAVKNIHQRLHAVMKEVDYIQKEQKKGMNYTIVSHDAVTAKVRPALVQHGVVYYPVKIDRTQDGNRTQMDVIVRFVNIDQPTDFIDVACCGYGIDPQDKGPGKATSYAVKYALLKALGLETGDEPDHENIPHERAPKTQPAANRQETKSEPAKPPAEPIVLFLAEGEVQEFPRTVKGALAYFHALDEAVRHDRFYWMQNAPTAEALGEKLKDNPDIAALLAEIKRTAGADRKAA